MESERARILPSADDASLVRSCLLANQDPEVAVIEEEWDKLHDPVTERWDAEEPGLSQHTESQSLP